MFIFKQGYSKMTTNRFQLVTVKPLILPNKIDAKAQLNKGPALYYL